MQIGIEIGFISGESAPSGSNVPLPVESITGSGLVMGFTSVAPAAEVVVGRVALYSVL